MGGELWRPEWSGLKKLLAVHAATSGGSLLPPEYQQVEYISIPNGGSRYQSYILTGIQYTKVKRIVCKYEVIIFTSNNSSPMFIASYTDASDGPIQPFATIAANSGFTSVEPTHEPPYEGIKDTYTIDVPSSDKYLRIGGWSDNNWTAAGNYYYVDVYDENGKIASFVPCYRKSDNKAGMYETIGGNFFASNGTIDFAIPE